MAMAIPARLTAKEGRKFAFTVAPAFLILGAVSAWRGHVWPPRVFWAVGSILLVAGLLIPGRLGPVYQRWMALGAAIGKITQPIVVAVSYYVLLTPLGVVMRLFGWNALRHQQRNGGFWVPRQSGGSSLDNQF